MELFIPSLFVIGLAGIVFFFILPKAAPYTLGVTAALLFGVGLYQHYLTFPYEYSTGRFREVLKDYSPFLMLLATILALVIGVTATFGGNPPSIMNSLPELPDVSSLINTPVSLPNIGGNVFGGNASTAKNSLLGNVGLGGNVKRNNLASTSFKVT